MVAILVSFGSFSLPQVSEGSIDVAQDGPLAGTAPDFWHDPVVGGRLKGSAFTITLKDKRTGCVPYELKVDETDGSEVDIRQHYDGLRLHAVAWSPTVR